jgi:hypothetical protein
MGGLFVRSNFVTIFGSRLISHEYESFIASSNKFACKRCEVPDLKKYAVQCHASVLSHRFGSFAIQLQGRLMFM